MTFTRPVAPPEIAPMVWRQWATCPTTGDPILIAHLPGDENRPVGTFDEALEVAFKNFCSAREYDGESVAFKAAARELFSVWKGRSGDIDMTSLKAARLKLERLCRDIGALPIGQARSDLVHTYQKLSAFLFEAVGHAKWSEAQP